MWTCRVQEYRHSYFEQDDYEIFKDYMEEKADRQNTMVTSLDGFDARLENAEATISAVTDNMESSAKEMEVSLPAERKKNEFSGVGACSLLPCIFLSQRHSLSFVSSSNSMPFFPLGGGGGGRGEYTKGAHA